MPRRGKNRPGASPLRQSARTKACPPAGQTKGALLCEVDAVPGLESVAVAEIQHRLGKSAHLRRRSEDRAAAGALQFQYTGALDALLRLRTVYSVYLVSSFQIARPRALLGHEHFHRLVGQIETVLRLWPANTFSTLYLDAAGSDSATMARLKAELAGRLALHIASGDGDLVLRIRRPPAGQEGWEVLIRLSARPLSVRPWRVCDRKGALNGAVAHAMVLLTDPQPADSFLNVACGSGTLAIERSSHGPAARIIGCDIDPTALVCARANAAAAGIAQEISFYGWDARALPIPDGSVDVLCGDLPFGNVIGSHEDNVDLYPVLLQECARVAKPGARACLLTHEVKLMEREIEATQAWHLQRVIPISVGGLHPRIFLLVRG